MKKLSWSKHLLLAGSIMVVAFACQCQKKVDTEQVKPSQDDNEDDDTCSQTTAPQTFKENAPAAKAQESLPVAPAPESVTEKASIPVAPSPAAAVSPEVIAPAAVTPSEAKAESPATEPSKLESVGAVSENRAPAAPSETPGLAPIQN